ncbi:MAG: ABC transporter ATP-binding protein [Acidimicrobiales bacterium]
MGDVLVSVQDLRKVYEPSPVWMRVLLRTAIKQPVTALDGVNFSVRAGELCAVVGPNGAGKSTLFRVLTGLTTPTVGSVSVMGLNPVRQSVAVRRVVGFVPADDRSLYLRHTARENLVFHGNLQGITPRARLRRRVDEVLELVGLDFAAERAGFALSAGMRSRLQLARALLHDPTVLILDEPTGSVDPVASHELLRLLETVTAQRGLAVLISSHRLEEIEALHDHVLLLDRGHVVYEGDLDSLRADFEKPRVVIRFATKKAALAACEPLQSSESIDVVSLKPPTVTLTSTLEVGRILGLLDGQLTDIESIDVRRISLRELLTKVAGR